MKYRTKTNIIYLRLQLIEQMKPKQPTSLSIQIHNLFVGGYHLLSCILGGKNVVNSHVRTYAITIASIGTKK